MILTMLRDTHTRIQEKSEMQDKEKRLPIYRRPLGDFDHAKHAQNQ